MTSFEPGGTERQMTELVRRLDPSRWEVHLACFEAKGPWFDRAAERAASVAEFPVRSFMPSDVAAPRLELRALVPQPAHRRRAGDRDLLEHLRAARRPRWPACRRASAAAAASTRIGRAAWSRCSAWPTPARTKVVANSQAAADQLRRERVPERKIAVMPNGLDFAPFAPRAAARPPLRKVAVVANLRPHKGHDVLIDAAVEILERFPDARFEIIGDGLGARGAAARAEAHGVAHAFTFVGHCDDVPARLADADIFVLPSRSESFPNAVLEAMAAGLPIVASASAASSS